MSQLETFDVGTPTTSAGAALVVQRLRDTFASGRTRSVEWRLEQLDALNRMLVDAEAELMDALAQDLGRPAMEAFAADLRGSGREIDDLRRHLRSWMKPERSKVPWIFRPARATVEREPLGAVLVIAPWNFPVYLMLTPLAAALAAGNTVCCKPSEVAPATSAALARWIPRYLDPAAVTVVEGGVPETTALLEQRWDHILYTGNGTVGRIVAEAAAKHLTPVTLELGGKSPVIVDADANVKLAASRVAYAKWLNAGQTCIAVDHVYVHRDVEDEFVSAVESEIKRRYGSDPRASADFGRVVNSGHTQRIKNMLDAGGYQLVCGGQVDVEQRYVAPTVLRSVEPDAGVMQDEIFGPVLPVIGFDEIDEPIAAINTGDKPLALYVFTDSDKSAERVKAETSSGGLCINDVIIHIAVSSLPFGGVGESGYGAYHGKWGFDTFSHAKAVLERPTRYLDLPALRPPYKPWKLKLTRRFF